MSLVPINDPDLIYFYPSDWRWSQQNLFSAGELAYRWDVTLLCYGSRLLS